MSNSNRHFLNLFNAAKRSTFGLLLVAGCILAVNLLGNQNSSTASAESSSETDTSSQAPNPYDSTTQHFYWNFFDDPAAPTNWRGKEYKDITWDVTIHNRDQEYWYGMESMQAHHGEQCQPPPQTLADHNANVPADGFHTINNLDDTVYICKGHVMTAINAEGYAMVYLTPPFMADWSGGEAVIRFKASTERSSGRDFIDVWVTPYEENLQLTLEEQFPDVAGEPKRALQTGLGINLDDPWRPARIENHEYISLEEPWNLPTVPNILAQHGLQPDYRRRETFEIRITSDRFLMTMPEYDAVLFDEELDPPLDWTSGVVQFGHHSYNPWKLGFDGPNTWHWDEFEIQPATPFTIIGNNRRYADGNNPTVWFDEPAPRNSHLRFAGIGRNLEYSLDGGGSWQTAQLQTVDESLIKEELFQSYWVEVPEGTQSVTFRGDRWYAGDWHIRDATLWSKEIDLTQFVNELDFLLYIPFVE